MQELAGLFVELWKLCYLVADFGSAFVAGPWSLCLLAADCAIHQNGIPSVWSCGFFLLFQ
jgi:hypothetical protein